MTAPDWQRLYDAHPPPLVASLQAAYDRGSVSFTPKELADAASTSETAHSEGEALALLEHAGDWLGRATRDGEPDPEYPDEPPAQTVVFVWQGVARRRPGWLLLVHGMNTVGRWQEHLAFDIGLWQGRVVPTFVFKYGRIWMGVALPWRRAALKKGLHAKIDELSRQAPEHSVKSAPDVVAHSFGTWLVGHILLDELEKPTGLRLGRVILTGSILRPDFPWRVLQDAGLVEEVLNHYGTKDVVVPLAHWIIADSGPSGRDGFDPPANGGDASALTNIVAPGFGHSQVLSDGRRFEGYSRTWKPFLTNPDDEAHLGLTDSPRERRWREAWWPLRGTLLPIVLGILLVALVAAALLRLGAHLASLDEHSADVASSSAWTVLTYVALGAAALAGLFVLDRIWWLVRTHLLN